MLHHRPLARTRWVVAGKRTVVLEIDVHLTGLEERGDDRGLPLLHSSEERQVFLCRLVRHSGQGAAASPPWQPRDCTQGAEIGQHDARRLGGGRQGRAHVATRLWIAACGARFREASRTEFETQTPKLEREGTVWNACSPKTEEAYFKYL